MVKTMTQQEQVIKASFRVAWVKHKKAYTDAEIMKGCMIGERCHTLRKKKKYIFPRFEPPVSIATDRTQLVK